MKRITKALGVSILCMSCFSSGLMADSLVKEIKATMMKNVEVTKNYQKQNLRGSGDEPLYPIMYQNRIYLPVKALEQLTDAEISWDQTNLRVNVNQKVAVQYVQIPVQTPTTTISNANTSYETLTTENRKKVDGYKSEITTLEKKVDTNEARLVTLYKDEKRAESRYSSSGTKEDREDLYDIREDIDYYENAVRDYKKQIVTLEDKIYAMYVKK